LENNVFEIENKLIALELQKIKIEDKLIERDINKIRKNNVTNVNTVTKKIYKTKPEYE